MLCECEYELKEFVLSFCVQSGDVHENYNNLFCSGKFLDEKGVPDVKKMTTFLYKAKNFDNAVKTAASQYFAKGKESVVKDIKNVNFKPDGQMEKVAPKTLGDQIGESIAKSFS